MLFLDSEGRGDPQNILTDLPNIRKLNSDIVEISLYQLRTSITQNGLKARDKKMSSLIFGNWTNLLLNNGIVAPPSTATRSSFLMKAALASRIPSKINSRLTAPDISTTEPAPVNFCFSDSCVFSEKNHHQGRHKHLMIANPAKENMINTLGAVPMIQIFESFFFV